MQPMASPKLSRLYCKLFNKILNSSHFPEAWSTGLIVPIYKNKGDRSDCNNYRGITLLSCLGKLFTSILNERLKQYCNVNNIISENQAGFREKYSTTDHIFSLKLLIDLFVSKKLKHFCAFIDYKKAFDSVDRDLLLYKLSQIGVDGRFYSAIKSFTYIVCNIHK